MSNEFSTPKLTPADNVKIPGVDGNNDSGYLLSEEVKDYMVGGLFGDVPEYSTLETYSVGARAMNGGDLYRCTTPVSTPEVFDPTKWTKVDLPSLDERVSDNEEDIATNATNIQANADAITSLNPTLVWTNPSPTAEFSPQQIVPSRICSHYYIRYRLNTSYDLANISTIISDRTQLIIIDTGMDNLSIRNVSLESNGNISIGVCVKYSLISTSAGQDNTYCIPTDIYGWD